MARLVALCERRHLMAVVVALILFGTLSRSADAQEGRIFLVRHAEKLSDDTDTPLSQAGQKRAQCLADTLRDVQIRKVVVTQYQRTRQTAAPLIKGSNAEVLQVDARSIAASAEAARNAARSGNVLVVGHSNSLPQLIKALGGPEMKIPDTTYDLLFVLAPANPAQTLTLHYCADLPKEQTAPNSEGQRTMAPQAR